MLATLHFASQNAALQCAFDGGAKMLLGSVGSSTWSAVASTVEAASAVVGVVAGVVTAHPVLSVVAAVGAYEVFGGSSGNPLHLGQNIDTKA